MVPFDIEKPPKYERCWTYTQKKKQKKKKRSKSLYICIEKLFETDRHNAVNERMIDKEKDLTLSLFPLSVDCEWRLFFFSASLSSFSFYLSWLRSVFFHLSGWTRGSNHSPECKNIYFYSFQAFYIYLSVFTRIAVYIMPGAMLTEFIFFWWLLLLHFSLWR